VCADKKISNKEEDGDCDKRSSQLMGQGREGELRDGGTWGRVRKTAIGHEGSLRCAVVRRGGHAQGKPATQ
jgi:hypothetical protein